MSGPEDFQQPGSSSNTHIKIKIENDNNDTDLNPHEKSNSRSLKSTTKARYSLLSNQSVYRRYVKQGKTNYLKNLLGNVNFGRALKNEYARKSELSHSSSLLLCEIIVGDLINDCDAKATNADFSDITDEIIDVFPNEERETYFIEPIYKNESIKNVSRRARGRLPDMFHNKLRLFRQMSGYTKSNKSHKPSEELPITDDVNESLQWLENNNDFNEIEAHWRKTTQVRQRLLRESEGNVNSYLEKYSLLLDPERGYKLIEIDFKELHSTASSIYAKWDSFIRKIINVTASKKFSSNIQQYRSWILDDATSQHAKEFIEIRLLSFLIAPRASISVKNRKIWKPSSQESQDGMAVHVKEFGDIEEKHRAKVEKMQDFGLSVKPYIIGVGDTEDTVNEFYVVFEKIRYRFDSPIKALDSCFKIFFALNVKFAPESHQVWLLIQRGLYEIRTEYDEMKPDVAKILQIL